MKLTDEQKATLTNALSVSATRFSDHAKELRRGPPQRDLVAVFEKQEKDTRALLELFQDGDMVDVVPVYQHEYQPPKYPTDGPCQTCLARRDDPRHEALP